ncbi:MAG TPA: hypothetical protein VJ111_17745 [Chitinophagaceae bacterium]|nr:hypothetical protein [Chitinophagaceae bacterium]
MPKQFSGSAKRFMVLIAVVAWLALIFQLYIMLRNAETNGLTPLVATWNFFNYFTILTNLLVALCLSFILIKPASSPGHFFSKPSTSGRYCLIYFYCWAHIQYRSPRYLGANRLTKVGR